MAFCSGILTAQSLQKGNLIGTHVFTINLQPGVSQEQFVEFFKTKWAPQIEKDFGWKAYIVKGIRGENPNSLGLIYVIKSEKNRDRFYNPDDTQNDTSKDVEKTSAFN